MVEDVQDSRPYRVTSEVLRRFDQRQTVFGRRLHERDAPFYRRNVHENAAAVIARGEPGYDRIEYARFRGAWAVSTHFRGAYAWDKLGGADPVTAELGAHPVADPAAMSEQVKATARTYGADLVGIAPLDLNWVYSHDLAGRPIRTPPECKWAIVIAVAMDAQGIMASPAFPAATATGIGYSRMAFAISCMAEFCRHLGYRAIPMGNDTALSIPLAIDAGLGELGRNGLLVTPQYGPCVRICKVLTDMPLAPDGPAPFGVTRTCVGCRKCARACEAGAISFDREPSFRVTGPSNREGVQRWAVDGAKCYTFWLENGASCSTCISACPYTQRAL